MRKSIDKGGLQGSRKKSVKNSVSSLKKRSSRLISHGFRTSSRKFCRNPNSAKAVQYSLSHKEALQAFLKSGNAALSNNICERAIRNFTIGRKNWLFSDSPKGAKASAAVYSIIETAQSNG